MFSDIKCAKCEAAIEAGPNSHAEAIGRCPVCGVSDTIKNIVAEAEDYKFQKTTESIDRAFQDIARGTKGFQVTPPGQQKRVFRFILD